jgi:hypothetical protein
LKKLRNRPVFSGQIPAHRCSGRSLRSRRRHPRVGFVHHPSHREARGWTLRLHFGCGPNHPHTRQPQDEKRRCERAELINPPLDGDRTPPMAGSQLFIARLPADFPSDSINGGTMLRGSDQINQTLAWAGLYGRVIGARLSGLSFRPVHRQLATQGARLYDWLIKTPERTMAPLGRRAFDGGTESNGKRWDT